ncbi:phospho-sugar mutase [Saxibacter everestensis]|uniref:Phospho-sugar mutase n=1 Tax=Saxibacter everestensis TaxID=2909229 RepID=A0ABY8QNZ0_9MICO|nr:phospho-sugar mutase [Brevibacteriaceae bacterium ZFBP1038]
MTTLPPDIADAAKAWLTEDPDQKNVSELGTLIDRAEAGDLVAGAEIQDRFGQSLAFGTAGLRGAMSAGPNRMNRVVVARAAAGLSAYLLECAAGSYRPRVVIGYDARHNSARFAHDSAAIMTAAGIEVLMLSQARPTPVLAFAVQRLEAEAGVMVTASHNPAIDNGYKVYLGGRMVAAHERGAQIVEPHDRRIAEKIAQVGRYSSIRRADGWTTLAPTRIEGYLSQAVRRALPGGSRDLSIVYTPMHGVGKEVALAALQRAGFHDVHVVAEQADPDPEFPTVPFPNPEEPGALDLAIQAAVERHADIIIANDPDADRCAVAVPTHDGEFRQLSGDEVGSLLGWYIARGMSDEDKRAGVFANSIVSSRQLAAIAAAADISHRETLTGFKWISRVKNLVFGYEEALGYCVDPESVRDKDGISTAVLIADLAAELDNEGLALLDVLDELAAQHGVHLTQPVTIRVEDLSRIHELLRKVAAEPPAELAGSPVTEIIDLAAGSTDLPPTPGFRYLTEDNSRVIIRPSGTEPKLKCYLEVVEQLSGDRLAEARATAAKRLRLLVNDVEEMLGV